MIGAREHMISDEHSMVLYLYQAPDHAPLFDLSEGVRRRTLYKRNI